MHVKDVCVVESWMSGVDLSRTLHKCSIQFKSGELPGHSSLEIKFGKSSVHHPVSQHQCEVSHHLEQTLLVPGNNFRSSILPQFQCRFQFFLKNIGHVVICIDSSSGWNNMKFGQTVNANRAPYHDFGTWFDTADAWYLVWLGPPHNIVLSVWDMEQIFCRLIAKDVLLPVFSGQMFEFASKLQSSLPLHFR